MKSRHTTSSMGAAYQSGGRVARQPSTTIIPADQLEAYIQARELLRRIKGSCTYDERGGLHSHRAPRQ